MQHEHHNFFATLKSLFGVRKNYVMYKVILLLIIDYNVVHNKCQVNRQTYTHRQTTASKADLPLFSRNDIFYFIIHPCDPSVVICYLIRSCDIAVHITYLISHRSFLNYNTVIKRYFRLGA